MPMTIEPIYATDTQTTEVSYDEPANVTFYDDGITIQETVYCGELLKEPSHVEKDGYRFLGWFVKGTDVKWDFSAPVTEHLNLESRFEQIKTDPKKEDTDKKEDNKKDESKKDSSSTSSNKKDSKGVNTSDQTNVIYFGGLVVLSISGIYLLTRRKREGYER